METCRSLVSLLSSRRERGPCLSGGCLLLRVQADRLAAGLGQVLPHGRQGLHGLGAEGLFAGPDAYDHPVQVFPGHLRARATGGGTLDAADQHRVRARAGRCQPVVAPLLGVLVLEHSSEES